MKKALLILHQKTSEAGNIEKKLIQRGFILEYRRPPLGDILPTNIEEYNAIVIFGGPMSANDEDQFIKDEINWIGIVLKSKVPFLGICLGAQMLAKHLGGKVKKIDCNSSEIGFFEIKPTKSGIDIFDDQKFFFQWHNEGFDLPKDSTMLASGKKFKVQAFKHKNCYAIQFHPEVNFKLHIKWLYYTLFSNPKRLFTKGSQNVIYQLFLRIKYSSKISRWLDSFLDQYFLKKTV